MKSRNGMIALGLVGSMCLLGAAALTTSADQGQKEKNKQRGKDRAEQRGTQQAMPSEDEMMQAWMEFGAPNEHHALLEKFVGNWQLESTYWMAPGAPAETSVSYSEAKIIMGGRYLSEEVKGEMEMPGGETMQFQGSALVGYDNAKKMYFSYWIDNFSTSVFIEWGSINEKGQLITKGSMFNPMYGKETKTKSTVTFVDDNTRTLEMWMEHPEEGMFKHMEITYTRQ